MYWLTNARLVSFRGLQQGIPVSSAFHFGGGSLSPSLGRVVQGDFMEEIRVGSAADGHLSVFHMFFADDKHLFVG